MAEIPNMYQEEVSNFNSELASLCEVKPPISKAKMSQLTKTALRAIKMYKHVVQSVERFIIKCKPQYKLPAVYVIDSIVRNSRHQYGAAGDVFGPRFMRNFKQTFQNLFTNCPPEDRPKIVRVLNLWQHNTVFPAEAIQPLLDMANPNNPLKSDSPPIDSAGSTREFQKHLKEKFEKIKAKSTGHHHHHREQKVERINKNVLAYDYDDDDDGKSQDGGETPTEAEPPVSEVLGQENFNNQDDNQPTDIAKTISKNLLMNPELFIRKLSQIQSFSQLHQQQPSTSNEHNVQSTVNNLLQSFSSNVSNVPTAPPPIDVASTLFDSQTDNMRSSEKRKGPDRSPSGHQRSSRSPDGDRSKRSRYSRGSDHRRGRRSRSRSPWAQSSSADRNRSDRRSSRDRRRSTSRDDVPLTPESLERQKERERKRAGIPQPRKEFFTICSRTLWLGHLPKMVSDNDVTELLKNYGDIESIELIPPRGCAYVSMKTRRDANYILSLPSKSFRIHGYTVKMAWAPGKGMKDREFKDYWDVDLGASFLPYSLMVAHPDLDLLEEGSMMDEESLPLPVKEFRQIRKEQKQQLEAQQKAVEELAKQAQLEEDGQPEMDRAKEANPPVSAAPAPLSGLPPINFSIPPPNLNMPPPSITPSPGIPGVPPPLLAPTPTGPPPPIPRHLMETIKQLTDRINAGAGPPRMPQPMFTQPPPNLNVPPNLKIPPPGLPPMNLPPPPLPFPPGQGRPPDNHNRKGRGGHRDRHQEPLSGSNAQPLGTPQFNPNLPPPMLLPFVPPKEGPPLGFGGGPSKSEGLPPPVIPDNPDLFPAPPQYTGPRFDEPPLGFGPPPGQDRQSGGRWNQPGFRGGWRGGSDGWRGRGGHDNRSRWGNRRDRSHGDHPAGDNEAQGQDTSTTEQLDQP